MADEGTDIRSRLLEARAAGRRGLNRVLDRAGLEVVPTRPPDRLEPEFERMYEHCRPYTMTSQDRMYALWQAARYVSDAKISGDVVECGVWRGGSTMLAAMALDAKQDDRRLWLYDTFEGMVEPGPQDTAGAFWKDPHEEWEAAQAGDHNEWCYAPIDEVRAGLRSTGAPEARFELVRGKVEETLAHTTPESIALLRLDTDWYESTKHELEHLFPLLQPGGVLIVDDYGQWEGQRRAIDEYFERHGVRMLLHRIDYAGRIGIKS